MADRMRLASPDIHLHRVMLSKHRRGPWSSAEDACLLDLVRTQGASNWVRISQLIGTRSPKQCRERYHQNLKPSLNLDAITPEEGVMIERMVAEMGKRWAEIARRLHGRSDNAVKNWWNGGMNRRKRLDNRRSDVPRHHHHHHHDQHHSQMHYAAQPQQSYDHHYAAPQQHPSSYQHSYPTQQHQVAARSYPVTSPTAISTVQSVSTHRYEAPLPSPSAFSTVSRAESADGGAPPSMISDASYSSFPNPATPTQLTSETLPRLSILNTHSKPAVYHHHSTTSPSTSYNLSSYATTSPTKQYPLLAERWAETSPRTPEVASPVARQPYTGPQLQLPSFSTVVAANRRSVSPGSPGSNKDGRMDLSKMLH